MTKAESDILPEVLVAVTDLPAGMFWRQNTGTFRTMDGKRIVKVSATGVGDIMGCYRGRGVAIETKTLIGEQRKSQILFERAWVRAGGLYIVARSVDDALRGLGDVG